MKMCFLITPSVYILDSIVKTSEKLEHKMCPKSIIVDTHNDYKVISLSSTYKFGFHVILFYVYCDRIALKFQDS